MQCFYALLNLVSIYISKVGNKFDGSWVIACLYVMRCCHIYATTIFNIVLTVSQLRRFIPGVSLRRPDSSPRFVHVEFVIYEVAIEKVFLPSNSIFPFSFHFISDEYSFIHHSGDEYVTHDRPHFHKHVLLSNHKRIQEHSISSRIIMNR
jgi:hypothetical protein